MGTAVRPLRVDSAHCDVPLAVGRSKEAVIQPNGGGNDERGECDTRGDPGTHEQGGDGVASPRFRHFPWLERGLSSDFALALWEA